MVVDYVNSYVQHLELFLLLNRVVTIVLRQWVLCSMVSQSDRLISVFTQ